MTRRLSLAVLLGLGLVGASRLALARPVAARLAQNPNDAPLAYDLVDTWQERPWTLTPGRYAETADVSSAPDGSIYILDSYQRAVHVLAADGQPLSAYVVPVPNQFALSRLDVGFDGDLNILGTSCERCPPRSAVYTLTPSGIEVRRFEVGERYSDVAQRKDGRLYLTRPMDSGGRGRRGVDVYSSTGQFQETLSPPELDTPSRVDVAEDGNIWVLHEVPQPPPPPDPRPRVPPGPSQADAGSKSDDGISSPFAGGPAAPAVGDRSLGTAQETPVTGVIHFAPNHQYVDTTPFDNGIDLAVGAPGVFVARYGQVFHLGDDDPLTPLVGQRWTGRISLDVHTSGKVLGSLAHCYFQGVLTYAAPVRRPSQPTLAGMLDRPALEGPVHARRVAADPSQSGAAASSPYVLQGRFTNVGTAPDKAYTTQPTEPQSVQRWGADGTLLGQLGLCGRTLEAAWIQDVAVDQGDVYTVDPSCVERRPDDQFPAWQVCLDGLFAGRTTQLAAVAASGGHIAVLDAGAGGVAILDQGGQLLHSWPVEGAGGAAPAGPRAPIVDIALAGDRVLLADAGLRQVRLFSLDGAAEGGFEVGDTPTSLAMGPEGDVYVVTRGKWGLRYRQDGTLVAAWRLPPVEVNLTDIAVGSDGRVFVSFAEFDDYPDATNGSYGIWESGVWVFAPAKRPATDVPGLVKPCEVVNDKRARPASVPVNTAVNVSLSVAGTCPPKDLPIQLAIVFDTSGSMNWGYALTNAKAATLRLLARLDPRLAEVSLVTFADQSALMSPPSRDLVAISRQVAALSAVGDTQMAMGIRQAAGALGTARDPKARQVLLLVTDANPKDATAGALADAAADGITLGALVFQSGQRAQPAFVDLFLNSGGEIVYDPSPWAVDHLSTQLFTSEDIGQLFQTITIVDTVPANMRYIAGSAIPAVTWDASTRALTWQLTSVSVQDGVRLSYQLAPQECGDWPTNVEAHADYRDGTGYDGHLVFPVPRVTVTGCRPLAKLYLPFAIRQSCTDRLKPVDVVLVLDASESMSEPAPGGGTKLEAARAAAGGFLAQLRLPDDHAAVVAFNSQAYRLGLLSGDAGSLMQALASLASAPGTRIDLGLEAAARVLADGHRPAASPVVILLTDGLQNGDAAPVRTAAAALKASAVTVFAIALGADADQALLGAVATTPDRLYVSPTATDLAAIYGRISERLGCD